MRFGLSCGWLARISERGFTLVELIVATAILLILTSVALPLARVSIKREKERELRRDLWEMRDAIDRYKGAAGGAAGAAVQFTEFGDKRMSLRASSDGSSYLASERT